MLLNSKKEQNDSAYKNKGRFHIFILSEKSQLKLRAAWFHLNSFLIKEQLKGQKTHQRFLGKWK